MDNLDQIWAKPPERAVNDAAGFGTLVPDSKGRHMPRHPRDQLFNKNDFSRLVDSARVKGLPIKRIDAKRDGLSLIVGDPAKDAGTDNALDQWMAIRAD
jgi:hypothetical protein